MNIIEFDRHDPLARTRWFEIEETVLRHDQPYGWARSFASFEASVSNPPSEYHLPVRLAAVGDSGDWLGTVETGLALQENTHLAEMEVLVRPTSRRRGVGTALFRAGEGICGAQNRTSIEGEVHVPAGASPENTAGHAFSRALGFVSVHEEDHLILDLPVPEERIARLQALDVSGAAYDVLTWGGRCPDEYVEAYCAMRTQMSKDVPLGDSDWLPVGFDEARLRTSEERLSAGWIPVIAAARRRGDGEMGGYSMTLLPIGGDQAMQDDTLVMPGHRGHRLGTRLKLATLAIVAARHSERRSLHTWTDPQNHAMQRTNADFGYVARERMHAMQRRTPGP